MSAENPQFQNQLENLVRESQRFAHRIGGDPEVLDEYAAKLLRSLLDAREVGLTKSEIEAAILVGFRQGELQLTDPSLTAEYWQEIRREVENK
jgi:glutamine synthetase adenylyltransferase